MLNKIFERKKIRKIKGKGGRGKKIYIYIDSFIPFYLISDSPTIWNFMQTAGYCILGIKQLVLRDPDLYFMFSDGNSASHDTIFYSGVTHLYEDKIDFNALSLPFDQASKIAKYGNDYNKELKRVRNAELLIYTKSASNNNLTGKRDPLTTRGIVNSFSIPTKYIDHIYCNFPRNSKLASTYINGLQLI